MLTQPTEKQIKIYIHIYTFRGKRTGGGRGDGDGKGVGVDHRMFTSGGDIKKILGQWRRGKKVREQKERTTRRQRQSKRESDEWKGGETGEKGARNASYCQYWEGRQSGSSFLRGCLYPRKVSPVRPHLFHHPVLQTKQRETLGSMWVSPASSHPFCQILLLLPPPPQPRGSL